MVGRASAAFRCTVYSKIFRSIFTWCKGSIAFFFKSHCLDRLNHVPLFPTALALCKNQLGTSVTFRNQTC